MFRTVSIMPGMENLAPDRTLTSSGSAGVAELAAHRLLQRVAGARLTSSSRARRGGALAPGSTRHASVVMMNPGGTGRPEIGHLGQVRALAAEQVLQVLVALGEVVDELPALPAPRSTRRLVVTRDSTGEGE